MRASGGASHIICIDIDAAAVRAAARHRSQASLIEGDRQRIAFVAADMHHLPFGCGAFDVAVSRWAFMFSTNAGNAFREARRVLRPGGRLAFAVWASPSHNPWQSVLDRLLTAYRIEDRTTEVRPGGMFGLSNERALRRVLAEAGFSIEWMERVPLMRSYRDFEEFWALEVDVGTQRPARLRALPPATARAFRRELELRLSAFASRGAYDIPGLVLAVAGRRPPA